MPRNLAKRFEDRLFKAVFRMASGAADLIDIAMSMFIILILLLAVFSAAGTYRHIHRARLDNVATKVASREIERLRQLDYDLTPPFNPPTYTLATTDDPDLVKLPNATATRTTSPYIPPDCYQVGCTDPYSPDKKKITVTVTWVEQGQSRQVSLDTIVSRNGLVQNTN